MGVHCGGILKFPVKERSSARAQHRTVNLSHSRFLVKDTDTVNQDHLGLETSLALLLVPQCDHVNNT